MLKKKKRKKALSSLGWSCWQEWIFTTCTNLHLFCFLKPLGESKGLEIVTPVDQWK
jgi:hypothetical protein